MGADRFSNQKQTGYVYASLSRCFIEESCSCIRGGLPKITAIDVSGAGAEMFQGTFGISVDSAGDIAGTYLDPSLVSHGFVRTPDGKTRSLMLPERARARRSTWEVFRS